MDYAKREVGHIKSMANLARSRRRAPCIIPQISAVRVSGPMHCGNAPVGSPTAEITE